MTFFPAMRLSAANPRRPNHTLTIIRTTLPKTPIRSNLTADVPIPPESYRGLHLVTGSQIGTALPSQRRPRVLQPLSVLRDRVTALAAALLLILAAT
jgi:hypothetical protein